MHASTRQISTALAFATLLICAPLTHADEHEDLEKLRATVLSLIDTLVQNRILPKSQADAMMRQAEARANARLAMAPAPEVGADGKKIVRVPYVPESVKTQMRDEIKAEVLAETRKDGFGPMLASDGEGRIQFEGDIRVRAEATQLDKGNTDALTLVNNSTATTRIPDAGTQGTGINNNVPRANTLDDQGRTRIRARAGVTVKANDSVMAGFGIATGNITGPTSTNQTLGAGNSQNSGFFNKSTLLVDKAYIRYEPERWLSLTAGRFGNPFMGTDLVWADDLNFEGFVGSLKPRLGPDKNAFLTVGWFPLTTQVKGLISRRSLTAAQVGFDWQLGLKDNHLKLAAALYDYQGIEGQPERCVTLAIAACDLVQAPNYGTRSEYAAGYRQKGNTLFNVVNPADRGLIAPIWGLASSFREVDLTGSFDMAAFDPVHIVLTGDVVYNRGFKKAEIQKRTGLKIEDGSALGYMGRVLVGWPTIKKAGEWSVSLAYRRLGSDAVLDAFTNSDFGLGGTNNKGTILGVNYGIAPNTWLAARWLSSDSIDTLTPDNTITKSKFSADVFQLDLNTRF